MHPRQGKNAFLQGKNGPCIKHTKGLVRRPQPHCHRTLVCKVIAHVTSAAASHWACLYNIHSTTNSSWLYFNRYKSLSLWYDGKGFSCPDVLDEGCTPRLLCCSSARQYTNLSCYDALIFLFWYDIHRLVLCVLWSGIYWIWSFSFRSITIEDKKRQHRSDGCCLMIPLRHTHTFPSQAAPYAQMWDIPL